MVSAWQPGGGEPDGGCVLDCNLLQKECTGCAPTESGVGEGSFPEWGLSGKDFVIAYGLTWKIKYKILAWSWTPLKPI